MPLRVILMRRRKIQRFKTCSDKQERRTFRCAALVLRGILYTPAGIALQIAPNPSAEEVTISAAETDKGLIAIVSDLTGKTIARFQLAGAKATLQVKTWPAGIYLLDIGSQTFKIEKK